LKSFFNPYSLKDMRYISTRGGIDPISFRQAIMMGLATDGGLLLPERIPTVDDETIEKWKNLAYPSLAFEVMRLFVNDIPDDDLKDIIVRSYASFEHPEVVPIVKKNDIYIMELFYGPTYAFKDIALQFLGNLFEYLLSEKKEKMNILGATSGDTGSAAIYGVKGRKNMAIFMLHPHNRVSFVQELQMTTVDDPNVHNLAIEGTFDDCQAIVKELFSDLEFKALYHLGAVNSINWARVLAQVVYYIWGVLKVAEENLLFAVPTGNFGNIFAGYLAKRILSGRIDKLILATNENDILYRFITKGDYSIGKVIPTISPSMDIQVASNFERYLYYLWEENDSRVREGIEIFKKEKALSFTKEEIKKASKDFISAAVNQKETLLMIREFYKSYGYILDPHTAVGVKAALSLKGEHPVICLATAHPAKFPDAVEMAIGKKPEPPPQIAHLIDKKRRVHVLSADTQEVKRYIELNAI